MDVLVTWESSRAQRDLSDYAKLRALCVEHGVKWFYQGRLFDLTDDDDRFSTGIDALVAEREAGLTRKRIIRNVEARAAAGTPHGRPHDGYKIVYDPNTGKAIRRVLDPERAPIIREIVRRLLAGETAYGIAKDFNQRGLTTVTGKPWRLETIVSSVRSPTIAGLRVFRGEVLPDVEAQWEPIVSSEDYNRVRALLAEPGRKTNHSGGKVKYIGSGVYRCGVCNGTMTLVSKRRPDDSKQVRYSCRDKFCVQRVQEPTDAKVELAMITFMSRPDIFAMLAESNGDAEVEAAKAEVARITAKLADIRAKVNQELLTLDDLVYFRAEWEPKLKAAEERARPKHIPTVVFEVAGPEAEQRWKATSVQNKRVIIKALMNVRIMPTGRTGKFDPESVVIERRRAQ